MNDPLAVRARATPDETALADAATGETWTVGDLDAAVEETAGRLAGLGVEDDRRRRFAARGVQRDPAGVDVDGSVLALVDLFVRVPAQDVIVISRVDERADDGLAGTVVDGDVGALEFEFAHLAEVDAEVVDQRLQGPLAVVVPADGVELERVGVEQPRGEGGDDVATVDDDVDVRGEEVVDRGLCDVEIVVGV